MARLIDADALIEKMRFDVCTDCLGSIKGCGNCYYERAINAIEDAPTVDAVEVVRCKDCVHADELDKHCEINGNRYRHCNILRGEEGENVWHKYKKYYKDYSIVEVDGFCDFGERKESE